MGLSLVVCVMYLLTRAVIGSTNIQHDNDVIITPKQHDNVFDATVKWS